LEPPFFGASLPLLVLFAVLERLNPTILGAGYTRWRWVRHVENAGAAISYAGWFVGVVGLTLAVHWIVGVAIFVGMLLAITISLGVVVDRLPKAR
jgi:hypothetical protein